MKYYIGLDGGGTKTKCILTDESLKPLGQSVGGQSAFLLVGTEQVTNTILELIEKICNENSINVSDISSIVLGSTGAGRRSDAERMENDFKSIAKSKGFEVKNFRVESDARIALEGAFSGKPGSILIAGTGSIMFGKDAEGNIHRVGGFGRFIGDEGSGYMIGRKGLMAAAKQFDGRDSDKKLTEKLKDKFSINDAPGLITEVYTNKFDIASAAPVIIEAAQEGDETCLQILNDEVKELLAHVGAMTKLLNEKIMKLCLIGGLISSENFYSQLFKSELEKAFDTVELTAPEMEPALGAALMAREFVK